MHHELGLMRSHLISFSDVLSQLECYFHLIIGHFLRKSFYYWCEYYIMRIGGGMVWVGQSPANIETNNKDSTPPAALSTTTTATCLPHHSTPLPQKLQSKQTLTGVPDWNGRVYILLSTQVAVGLHNLNATEERENRRSFYYIVRKDIHKFKQRWEKHGIEGIEDLDNKIEAWTSWYHVESDAAAAAARTPIFPGEENRVHLSSFTMYYRFGPTETRQSLTHYQLTGPWISCFGPHWGRPQPNWRRSMSRPITGPRSTWTERCSKPYLLIWAQMSSGP